MSDTAAPTHASVAAAPAFRPARMADIGLVHARLIEAVETSPHYTQAFKRYETHRLGRAHLAGLIETDPHHVLILRRDGRDAGLILSAPQLGALWLDWLYVFPEERRAGVAARGLAAFLAHWDGTRFHKVGAFTRAGNAVTAALFERSGFALTARLERHMFGEDYLLYEHRLDKRLPGYDTGVPGGLVNRLRRRVRGRLGL